MPAIFDGDEHGYTRNIPNRFSEERDDRLMNSAIGSYAREIFVKGEPTGHHFLNKADAKAMSAEVIATHQRDDRLAGDEDSDNRFEDTWTHFDVNHDGLVEAERMP